MAFMAGAFVFAVIVISATRRLTEHMTGTELRKRLKALETHERH